MYENIICFFSFPFMMKLRNSVVKERFEYGLAIHTEEDTNLQ